MEKKSILIFGAGKIGRSFIGQLFGASGYEVVFSDVDAGLVALLNCRKSYTVVVKGEKEETIYVSPVRAVDFADEQAVTEEIKNCSLMAVSVGKNALLKIIPVIAHGLINRYRSHENDPLDIIIAENMRSARDVVYRELAHNLPEDFPLDGYVGLIETSIGKMVPIMTAEEIKKDPLSVFAEPYNQLILDKKGFRNKIPAVNGLVLSENIKAWVDRKAFIHNLGHATAAYYGYFTHPEAIYLYEVLEDKRVLDFTREVMHQSADILLTIYADEFTEDELSAHIDDLLSRFRNRALKDTIFRVGQDVPRKLGADDRFMGIIRLAVTLKMPYEKILKAMTYALFFRAMDEHGNRAEQDVLFEKLLSQGASYALQKVSGIHTANDRELTETLRKLIKRLEKDR